MIISLVIVGKKCICNVKNITNITNFNNEKQKKPQQQARSI